MGWLEDALLAIRIAQYGSRPAPISDRDRESWIKAAEKPKPQLPRGRTAVRSALYAANPIRMRQLEGDIRWIKKHLKRMGLTPEDWKDYL